MVRLHQKYSNGGGDIPAAAEDAAQETAGNKPAPVNRYSPEAVRAWADEVQLGPDARAVVEKNLKAMESATSNVEKLKYWRKLRRWMEM